MICLYMTSCAGRGPVALPPDDPSLETGFPGKGFEDLSPRAQASLRLTAQAKKLIQNGQPNDAILTLERAINLNPANGLNYYFMAEAWLEKGEVDEAMKFNGLAASSLEESPAWMDRVEEQRGRIEEMQYNPWY